MFQHSKPFYGLDEAFEILGIGRSHGYKEIKRGRLKVVKNGKRTLVTDNGIDDYKTLLEKETEGRAA